MHEIFTHAAVYGLLEIILRCIIIPVEWLAFIILSHFNAICKFFAYLIEKHGMTRHKF